MNIQEKFNEWWSKAIKGKPGFQIVSCESDKWQYQFEGQQSPVTAAAACIWDDSQVYFNRSWNGKEPIAPGKKLFAVVKDDEKLMFVIEDVGLFPFGIKSDKGDHYRAALFVQCAGSAL